MFFFIYNKKFFFCLKNLLCMFFVFKSFLVYCNCTSVCLFYCSIFAFLFSIRGIFIDS